MKRPFVVATLCLASSLLFTGCLGLQIGGGDKKAYQNATLGQQLIDLKTARDTGAISEGEYQAQKSKLLGQPQQ